MEQRYPVTGRRKLRKLPALERLQNGVPDDSPRLKELMAHVRRDPKHQPTIIAGNELMVLPNDEASMARQSPTIANGSLTIWPATQGDRMKPPMLDALERVVHEQQAIVGLRGKTTAVQTTLSASHEARLIVAAILECVAQFKRVFKGYKDVFSEFDVLVNSLLPVIDRLVSDVNDVRMRREIAEEAGEELIGELDEAAMKHEAELGQLEAKMKELTKLHVTDPGAFQRQILAMKRQIEEKDKKLEWLQRREEKLSARFVAKTLEMSEFEQVKEDLNKQIRLASSQLLEEKEKSAQATCDLELVKINARKSVEAYEKKVVDLSAENNFLKEALEDEIAKRKKAVAVPSQPTKKSLDASAPPVNLDIDWSILTADTSTDMYEAGGTDMSILLASRDRLEFPSRSKKMLGSWLSQESEVSPDERTLRELESQEDAGNQSDIDDDNEMQHLGLHISQMSVQARVEHLLRLYRGMKQYLKDADQFMAAKGFKQQGSLVLDRTPARFLSLGELVDEERAQKDSKRDSNKPTPTASTHELKDAKKTKQPKQPHQQGKLGGAGIRHSAGGTELSSSDVVAPKTDIEFLPLCCDDVAKVPPYLHWPVAQNGLVKGMVLGIADLTTEIEGLFQFQAKCIEANRTCSFDECLALWLSTKHARSPLKRIGFAYSFFFAASNLEEVHSSITCLQFEALLRGDVPNDVAQHFTELVHTLARAMAKRRGVFPTLTRSSLLSVLRRTLFWLEHDEIHALMEAADASVPFAERGNYSEDTLLLQKAAATAPFLLSLRKLHLFGQISYRRLLISAAERVNLGDAAEDASAPSSSVRRKSLRRRSSVAASALFTPMPTEPPTTDATSGDNDPDSASGPGKPPNAVAGRKNKRPGRFIRYIDIFSAFSRVDPDKPLWAIHKHLSCLLSWDLPEALSHRVVEASNTVSPKHGENLGAAQMLEMHTTNPALNPSTFEDDFDPEQKQVAERDIWCFFSKMIDRAHLVKALDCTCETRYSPAPTWPYAPPPTPRFNISESTPQNIAMFLADPANRALIAALGGSNALLGSAYVASPVSQPSFGQHGRSTKAQPAPHGKRR